MMCTCKGKIVLSAVLAKDGALMCFVDLPDICASAKCV